MEEIQTNMGNKLKKKMSKSALVSFLFAAIGFVYVFALSFFLKISSSDISDMSIFFRFILLLFLILLSIIASAHIKKNKDKLKGKWLANLSLLIFIVLLGFYIILLMRPEYNVPSNAIIQGELSKIQVAMDEHYSNSNSYIGFTTNLVLPDCSDGAYTIQISPDGKHYLGYARLCWSNTRFLQGKRDVFWCIDSTGFSGKLEIESVPYDVYNCSLQK